MNPKLVATGTVLIGFCSFIAGASALVIMGALAVVGISELTISTFLGGCAILFGGLMLLVLGAMMTP